MNDLPIFLMLAGLGAATGAIAEKMGCSFAVWWMIGTLLFMVGLIVVLVLPQNKAGQHRGARICPSRSCPYCGERLEIGSRDCSACGHALPIMATTTMDSWGKTVAARDDVEKWASKQKRSPFFSLH
jgi:hypothetical protein